jgi:hypothetical protein
VRALAAVIRLINKVLVLEVLRRASRWLDEVTDADVMHERIMREAISISPGASWRIIATMGGRWKTRPHTCGYDWLSES